MKGNGIKDLADSPAGGNPIKKASGNPKAFGI